jgi:hypothetical protein
LSMAQPASAAIDKPTSAARSGNANRMEHSVVEETRV